MDKEKYIYIYYMYTYILYIYSYIIEQYSTIKGLLDNMGQVEYIIPS